MKTDLQGVTRSYQVTLFFSSHDRVHVDDPRSRIYRRSGNPDWSVRTVSRCGIPHMANRW